MGGIVSAIIEMVTLATEMSAATGLAVDTILTGEALAALEVEVSSLMTIEGLSGIEALAQLGWTAEQFSNLAFIATTFTQAIGFSTIFNTVSGLAGLISAGIRLGFNVSSVNRAVNETRLLRLFGRIEYILKSNLSHQFNPLDWCCSLRDNYPPEIDNLDINFRSNLSAILENARWVRQANYTTDPNYESGDVIDIAHSPGGTDQVVTPDWLLPVILRLHGAQTEAPLCTLPENQTCPRRRP
ncbi:minor capsid protein VP2 [Scotophilus kuhlii polyomavirus 1]|nr:minor capsid protein VP2 [Scotophilus kuhlii polyomavirus 1]